ncbi:hypothetical protein GCM10027442_40850 [Emticicia fontis]
MLAKKVDENNEYQHKEHEPETAQKQVKDDIFGKIILLFAEKQPGKKSLYGY